MTIRRLTRLISANCGAFSTVALALMLDARPSWAQALEELRIARPVEVREPISRSGTSASPLRLRADPLLTTEASRLTEGAPLHVLNPEDVHLSFAGGPRTTLKAELAKPQPRISLRNHLDGKNHFVEFKSDVPVAIDLTNPAIVSATPAPPSKRWAKLGELVQLTDVIGEGGPTASSNEKRESDQLEAARATVAKLRKELEAAGFKPPEATPASVQGALQGYRAFRGLSSKHVFDPQTSKLIQRDLALRDSFLEAEKKHLTATADGVRVAKGVWLTKRDRTLETWTFSDSGDLKRVAGKEAIALAESQSVSELRRLQATSPALLVQASTTEITANGVPPKELTPVQVGASPFATSFGRLDRALAAPGPRDVLIVRGPIERLLGPDGARSVGLNVLPWNELRTRLEPKPDLRIFSDDPTAATLERIRKTPRTLAARDIEVSIPGADDPFVRERGSMLAGILGSLQQQTGSPSPKKKSAVIAVSGHRGAPLAAYLDHLGATGKLRGRVVLLFSCAEEGPEKARLTQTYHLMNDHGALAVLTFPSRIRAEAVAKVLEGISEELAEREDVPVDRVVDRGIGRALASLELARAKQRQSLATQRVQIGPAIDPLVRNAVAAAREATVSRLQKIDELLVEVRKLSEHSLFAARTPYPGLSPAFSTGAQNEARAT